VPLKTSLPTLEAAVGRHYAPAGSVAAGAAAFGREEADDDALAQLGPAGSPIAQSVAANLRQAVRVRGDLARAFAAHGRPAPAAPPAPPKTRAGTRFKVPLDLDIDQHPYVADHSIVGQPDGWEIRSDLRPIIPLTMSLELMAEIAMAQAPGMKVIKISSVMATKFIDIHEPFHGTVEGHWKQENTVALHLPGHLSLEVTLGTEYPEPPPNVAAEYNRDLGKDIMEPLPPEIQYTHYTFHRPKYRPIVVSKRFGEHGFHNIITRREGKGSLLDNMGYSIGLFLHLHAPEPKVSFPVRVAELTFYQDMFDQEGLFDGFTVVRKITPNFVQADVAYLRDGRVWAIARGWINQRLEMHRMLWNVLTRPQDFTMAEEIAPGVRYFKNRIGSDQVTLVMGLRFLDAAEKERYVGATDESWREDFLHGRVALKDAVRAHTREPDGPMVFPIEVRLEYDESGKPSVVPPVPAPGEPPAAVPHVSLAHKNGIGVAIVGERPVGIDIERIAPREEAFLRLAFTDAERRLLAAQERSEEWAARFWAAKEAVAKLEGGGLGGDPKRFEVTRVAGERVEVRGAWVRTAVVDDDAIAWVEAREEATADAAR
jgi:phosphopantetheinyl transferase